MFLRHAIVLFAKEDNLSKYKIAQNSGLPQTDLNEIANEKIQIRHQYTILFKM